MNKTQLFHLNVQVVSNYAAFATQVSATGRDFQDAVINATEEMRAILAEEGDALISFDLI